MRDKNIFTPRYQSKRYKPVPLGGLLNHIGVFILCCVLFPAFITLMVIFGEQVDEFFSIWQRQFIFSMVILLGVGITWLIWRIKNMF